MQKTSVAIIGTTGLPARYGGFETLAQNLVDQLDSKFDITVYCSKKYYFGKNNDLPKQYKGAKLKYLPLNANGYQSIIYDFISIIHAVRNSDVLLVLGISGAIAFPFIKLFSKKPILVNIDGQEWKRAKWNTLAKKFLSFSERIAVKFADTVIADNKVIHDYVEQGYNRKQVELIEYGADHVIKVEKSFEALAQYKFLSSPYAFNVSRIEPENNVHLILEAFSKTPNRNLVIIGLWNHNEYGINLKAQYSSYKNLFLLDPIYQQEQLDMIRSNADLYIHGHSAGGTNPSLVEAMALGLPIACFDVSYNRETTSNSCVYFKDAKGLTTIINTITKSEKGQIANAMQSVAEERYTWKRITNCYAELFESSQPIAQRLIERVKSQEVKSVSVEVKSTQRAA
jgi:glycosyltransferase involved in cell wall biosynthesis